MLQTIICLNLHKVPVWRGAGHNGILVALHPFMSSSSQSPPSEESLLLFFSS